MFGDTIDQYIVYTAIMFAIFFVPFFLIKAIVWLVSRATTIKEPLEAIERLITNRELAEIDDLKTLPPALMEHYEKSTYRVFLLDVPQRPPSYFFVFHNWGDSDEKSGHLGLAVCTPMLVEDEAKKWLKGDFTGGGLDTIPKASFSTKGFGGAIAGSIQLENNVRVGEPRFDKNVHIESPHRQKELDPLLRRASFRGAVDTCVRNEEEVHLHEIEGFVSVSIPSFDPKKHTTAEFVDRAISLSQNVPIVRKTKPPPPTVKAASLSLTIFWLWFVLSFNIVGDYMAGDSIESINEGFGYLIIPIAFWVLSIAISWVFLRGRSGAMSIMAWTLFVNAFCIGYCRGVLYYYANCALDNSHENTTLVLSAKDFGKESAGDSYSEDITTYYLVFQGNDTFPGPISIQVDLETYTAARPGIEYDMSYGEGLLGYRWVRNLTQVRAPDEEMIQSVPIENAMGGRYILTSGENKFKRTFWVNSSQQNRMNFGLFGVLENKSDKSLSQLEVAVEFVDENEKVFAQKDVKLLPREFPYLPAGGVANVRFAVETLLHKNVSSKIGRVRIVEKSVTEGPSQRMKRKKVDYIATRSYDKGDVRFDIFERIYIQESKPNYKRPSHKHELLLEVVNTGSKDIKTLRFYLELLDASGDIFHNEIMSFVKAQDMPLKPGARRMVWFDKFRKPGKGYDVRIDTVEAVE